MFFLPPVSGDAVAVRDRAAACARADKGVGKHRGWCFSGRRWAALRAASPRAFVLIPHWGIGNIVAGRGSGLMLLAASGSSRRASCPKILPVGLALLGLISGIALKHVGTAGGPSVVFAADGLYEKIVIRDVPLRGRTARILLQDLSISGGVYVDDGSMAFDYTRYFDLYGCSLPN